MHANLPRVIFFGALILVGLTGAITYFAAAKLAAHVDPASHESHLSSFIVATSSVAVAVASAFPIFGRAVPWVSARLKAFSFDGDAAERALGTSGSFPSV
jgi:hypothetical protein